MALKPAIRKTHVVTTEQSEQKEGQRLGEDSSSSDNASGVGAHTKGSSDEAGVELVINSEEEKSR